MVNSNGKPENWDVLAKADAKVKNANEEDLDSIKENAMKDLESAQSAAIDLLKRVSSLKQNHEQIMAGPDAPRPDSKLNLQPDDQENKEVENKNEDSPELSVISPNANDAAKPDDSIADVVINEPQIEVVTSEEANKLEVNAVEPSSDNM